MPRNTVSTASVDLISGIITPSDPICIRENLYLTLTSVGTLSAANIRSAILRDSTLLATCSTFTLTSGNFTGTMSLNTTEFVAQFSGKADDAVRDFTFVAYDASDVVTRYLVNTKIAIQNQPITDATVLPGSVTPISVSTTVWGSLRLVNGIIYIYNTETGLWNSLTASGIGPAVHLDIGESPYTP